MEHREDGLKKRYETSNPEFCMNFHRIGMALNCYCYNAAIHGFCNIGEPEIAMQVLTEMKSCGINPDTHSYSILVEGFCRRGNIERGDIDIANKLLEEMINNKLAPNASSYESLIHGYSKNGSSEKALEVFQYYDRRQYFAKYCYLQLDRK
ncbi:unnamed protein product [Fraxinus pennsylvanica]|uniref:Pentatricopeptide repeat-containing protein n=1 Tax=Fraxinus pennsylvanica TaxID=56036 RepID=A0AAD1ZTF2_9LAMI|nr:unnamed protein product [Fraxinus pennsylvanica]